MVTSSGNGTIFKNLPQKFSKSQWPVFWKVVFLWPKKSTFFRLLVSLSNLKSLIVDNVKCLCVWILNLVVQSPFSIRSPAGMLVLRGGGRGGTPLCGCRCEDDPHHFLTACWTDSNNIFNALFEIGCVYLDYFFQCLSLRYYMEKLLITWPAELPAYSGIVVSGKETNMADKDDGFYCSCCAYAGLWLIISAINNGSSDKIWSRCSP